MKTFKMIGMITAAALMATALPGHAGKRNFGEAMLSAYDGPLPPAGYAARRWTHPNGCDYSLAGRPGERVWYLIINTLGNKDCVRYFVETPLPNDINVTRNLYKYN